MKNRIPISTLEYSSIGSQRSNGTFIFQLVHISSNLFFNAIVAITNAFKNRKIESEYLRNTFPAGFAVDGALELNQSQERKYKLRGSYIALSLIMSVFMDSVD